MQLEERSKTKRTLREVDGDGENKELQHGAWVLSNDIETYMKMSQ